MVMLDLMNYGLESVDKDDEGSSIINGLKECLVKTMDLYIFGQTHPKIHARINPYAVTSFFLDPENSALKFQDTMELLEKSSLTASTKILEKFEESISNWPAEVDNLIVKIDGNVNEKSPAVLEETPITAKLAKRLKKSGLPEKSSQTKVITVSDELESYRNFGQDAYIKCSYFNLL